MQTGIHTHTHNHKNHSQLTSQTSFSDTCRDHTLTHSLVTHMRGKHSEPCVQVLQKTHKRVLAVQTWEQPLDKRYCYKFATSTPAGTYQWQIFSQVSLQQLTPALPDCEPVVQIDQPWVPAGLERDPPPPLICCLIRQPHPWCVRTDSLLHTSKKERWRDYTNIQREAKRGEMDACLGSERKD